MDQFRECLFMQIIDNKYVNLPSLLKKFIFGRVNLIKNQDIRDTEDYLQSQYRFYRESILTKSQKVRSTGYVI
jgi:hypothetical protein